jgi:hypothetical protein
VYAFLPKRCGLVEPGVGVLAEPLGVGGADGALAPGLRPRVAPGVERHLERFAVLDPQLADGAVERVEQGVQGRLVVVALLDVPVAGEDLRLLFEDLAHHPASEDELELRLRVIGLVA